MRATAGRSTTTTTRALALAMALTIPLLSACGPDDDQGLDAVTGTAGQLQELVGGTAGAQGGADADPSAPVLSAPGGVAVNQGVRYTADTGHQRVLRTSAEGTCVLAGGEDAVVEPLQWCASADGARAKRQPELQHPTALTVDLRGDVFIADPVAARVFMVDAFSRTTSPVAGTGVQGLPVHGAVATQTPLHTPAAVSVTADGQTLYVADAGAHQVLAVDVAALTPVVVPSGARPDSPPPGLTPPLPGLTPPAPVTSGDSSPEQQDASSSSSSGTPSEAATPTSTSEGSDPLLTPAGDAGDQVLAAVRADPPPAEGEGSGSASSGAQQPDDGTGLLDPAAQPAESTAPPSEATSSGTPSSSAGEAPSDAPSGSPGASPDDTAGRLYVVAGPGCAPGPGGRPVLDATVPARTAGLSSPSALVVAEGGETMPELYVADRANHQVYVIDIAGGSVDSPRDLTTLSSDDPDLTTPVALAVAHPGGSRYVVAADADTHSVLKAESWERPLEWTPLTSALRTPSALAGDRSAVLVADSGTDTVYGLPLEDSEEVAASPPGEVQRLSASVPTAAPRSEAPAASAPGCPAAPEPVTDRGSRDSDFTPRSDSSSPRPTAPGHAAVPAPGAHRFSGDDRVATSVDTSKKLFPKAGSVPVVVISSASSYADSAGGARYAAEKGGSLLLTPGKELAPAVEAEVRRSLAAGGSIVVTGREAAIAPSVFSALEAIAPGRTERIGGVDRYETATELAQRLADQMTTTATGPIYLVTGADYPDALVVVSLARRTGGLVVLSKDDVLPPVTRALLAAMDPTGARTVPVGGAAAAAAASLGGDAGRTAAAAAVVGSDRYETARKVAERFVALDTAAGARTDVVGLATGTTWPDALVGSTAMGTLVAPLLLTHGDALDPNVVKALAAIPSSRPSTTVVFGGEAAVPASVMAAFEAAARG